jgi:hypothetical protein
LAPASVPSKHTHKKRKINRNVQYIGYIITTQIWSKRSVHRQIIKNMHATCASQKVMVANLISKKVKLLPFECINNAIRTLYSSIVAHLNEDYRYC